MWFCLRNILEKILENLWKGALKLFWRRPSTFLKHLYVNQYQKKILFILSALHPSFIIPSSFQLISTCALPVSFTCSVSLPQPYFLLSLLHHSAFNHLTRWRYSNHLSRLKLLTVLTEWSKLRPNKSLMEHHHTLAKRVWADLTAWESSTLSANSYALLAVSPWHTDIVLYIHTHTHTHTHTYIWRHSAIQWVQWF